MLLSGDEFANTQWGNNNAYCQDNEISWLDWTLLDKNKELFEYAKNLIAFRKVHPVLLGSRYDFGENGTGYPELSFHGTKPWEIDESAPNLSFGYMFAEDHKKYKTKKDCYIYVAVNAHWEEHEYELPVVPDGLKWYLCCEASGFSAKPGKEKLLTNGMRITLGPRSSVVLIAR